MYFRQLGTDLTIPRGMGTKIRLSRWGTPLVIRGGRMILSAIAGRGVVSAICAGMAEGGTNITPKVMSANSITGNVCSWEGARGYTDKTVIVSMANFFEGALESLSRELAYKLDRHARQTTSANATVAYAVCAMGKSAGTTNYVGKHQRLFGANVARIRPIMGANGCPAWDDGTYVGITHELAAYDMFSDSSATGFVSVARYNDARSIYRGEIGEFYGVRWLLSNASVLKLVGRAANGVDSTFWSAGGSATVGLSVGTTGTNAYVFSPDAFYNIELETGGVEVIHQPLGSGGATGDPTARNGSVGVKVYYSALPAPAGDKRMIRFVHALGLNV